jgi:S-adenosylmethionine:tRNA ribosyltransferase-isomerase
MQDERHRRRRRAQAGLRRCCRRATVPAVKPEAFDYALPPEQIAQHPAPRREAARMMVLRGEAPRVDAHVAAVREHLPPGALLVVNASRVVPARIDLIRSDGRRFELLVCAPAPGLGPGTSVRAWVRGAKRLRIGDVLAVDGLSLVYRGTDAIDGRARLFEVVTGEVLPALHARGRVPLPPYIDRAVDEADRQRYQTVYAGSDGSVAAPTAGLHLDEALVEALDPVRITLHVGPGTFLPMDVEDVRQHRVGAERIEIDESAATRIEAARAEGRAVVAVGTTVVRALESVALAHGGAVLPTRAPTDLVVTPGFRFQVIDHLLTNFHLPRSSLLMLVCSFGGHARVMAAYEDAVRSGYRFYSYGDCMLLDRAET